MARGIERRSTNWPIPLALAAGISACWTLVDRQRLSTLILPDPDDAMRLVQIRDWIGGQALADTAQYRLGLPGDLPMHWSRLPDLIPGGLIVLLQPLIGRHAAELTAVLCWPALLLATTLMLLGTIARTLSGQRAAGPVAMLLGVLAYPATGLFLPGRIDHHGLQLALLLAAALGTMRAGWRGGAASGLAAAAALAIGLETAPLHALLFTGAVLGWIGRGDDRTAQWQMAAGAALAGGVVVASTILAPPLWPAELCDSFTPPVAILAGSGGMALMLLGGGTRYLSHWRVRLAAAVLASAVIVIAAASMAQPCLLGPYGQVSPLLRRLWLDHVAESQPLLRAGWTTGIAQGGLMLAGLAAGTVLLAARRDHAGWSWLPLQVGCAALACVQLRLAPFGAALAVPVLAMAIVTIRQRRRPLATVMLWLVSAGIVYPLAGERIGTPAQGVARPDCLTTEHLARIAALGRVRIAAPIDLGPFILGRTTASVLAAPYHRNAGGNLAQFRLFLASATTAQAQAAAAQIDAIAYCPAALPDLDPDGLAAPDSIVALARSGQVPYWAAPVTMPSATLTILRVRR